MIKTISMKIKNTVAATTFQMCAAGVCALAGAPARTQANGQSHIMEIVVSILLVVVLGIFLYLTTVPEIESVINTAMRNIGTILPK